MDSPWYLLLVFTVALVQPTSGMLKMIHRFHGKLEGRKKTS